MSGADRTALAPTEASAAAGEAAELAAEVAATSGLELVPLQDPGQMEAAAAVLHRVWRGHVAIPADTMRALAFAGNYLTGAYAEGSLVGVSAGFLGRHGDDAVHLHSHITGVDPAARGRHAGLALKLHQRAWALERGIVRIEWTFDPLVRRNAAFNLSRLGARVQAYLVDFYGNMADGINAGQGSDRLWLEWAIDEPGATAGLRSGFEADVEPLIAAGQVLLATGPGGEPVAAATPPGRGPLACAVPPDIEAMRREDPSLARRWRLALREALAPALSAGRRVEGFDRAGWYRLSEAPPSGGALSG